MPRHIEVRVRVPVGKLGEFVDEVLPWWADMVGVDRMPVIDVDRPAKKGKPNGKAELGNPPAAGSVGAILLKRIKSSPGKTRAELFEPLKAKHPISAMSSSLYDLLHPRIFEEERQRP